MQEKYFLTTKLEQCPECGSTNIIRDYENKEYVCRRCGLVLEKDYSTNPERRFFTLEQEEKRSRTGAPITYSIHDKGLSTKISDFDRDVYGRPLKSEEKAKFYRLRKWQRKIRISRIERTLALGLDEIIRVSYSLSLPKNGAEIASIILRKGIKEKFFRGREIKGVADACVYAAYRQLGLPRTLEEVSKVSGTDKKEIGRNYRTIIDNIKLPSTLVLPISSYVSKIINSLNIVGKTDEVTHKIICAAQEIKLTSGRSPIGIAAAAAYLASVLTGERKTQKEISEIAGCTEVTIRNRYRELIKRLFFTIEL